MAIPLYLAMTAAEFAACPTPPSPMAWMACHFSAYGSGLSNFPKNLPSGTMIIVNDRIPIHGHNPDLICEELAGLVEQFHVPRVLLDFQRPNVPEASNLVQKLLSAIPCPTGVSAIYVNNVDAPVFLPPPLLNQPLAEHLAPWKGREIWLETAQDCACFTISEHGCDVTQQIPADTAQWPHAEDSLHCHYRIECTSDAVLFHLYRTWEDLTSMLAEAEALGVTTAVGLYQELG